MVLQANAVPGATSILPNYQQVAGNKFFFKLWARQWKKLFRGKHSTASGSISRKRFFRMARYLLCKRFFYFIIPLSCTSLCREFGPWMEFACLRSNLAHLCGTSFSRKYFKKSWPFKMQTSCKCELIKFLLLTCKFVNFRCTSEAIADAQRRGFLFQGMGLTWTFCWSVVVVNSSQCWHKLFYKCFTAVKAVNCRAFCVSACLRS